jgi:hypothetical protein
VKLSRETVDWIVARHDSLPVQGLVTLLVPEIFLRSVRSISRRIYPFFSRVLSICDTAALVMWRFV